MTNSGAVSGQASLSWTRVIVCVGDSCFHEVEGTAISCEYPGKARVFFGPLQHWRTGTGTGTGAENGRIQLKSGSMIFDVGRRALELACRRVYRNHARHE